MAWWSKLPYDLHIAILQLLPFLDQLQLRLVSRATNVAAEDAIINSAFPLVLTLEDHDPADYLKRFPSFADRILSLELKARRNVNGPPKKNNGKPMMNKVVSVVLVHTPKLESLSVDGILGCGIPLVMDKVGLLGSLKRLALRSFWFETCDSQALCQSKALENGLISLDLSFSLFTIGAMWRLTKAPFSDLKELKLASTELGNYWFRLLVESPHFSNLTSLDVSDCHVEKEGISHFVASKGFTNLTQLNLYKNSLGREGTRLFAQSDSFPQLTWLNIGDNFMEASGAQAIATSPHFQKLTFLNLQQNRIETEGVIFLAQSLYLTNLTSLNVSCNCVRDDGIVALGRSPHFPKLTSLDLTGNVFGINADEQFVDRSPVVNCIWGGKHSKK